MRPTATPMMQAKKLIRTDSVRNWSLMIPSLAPRAFRSPISRVLLLNRGEHDVGEPDLSEDEGHHKRGHKRRTL